ncbi:MAG TPA: GspL/Epsl periplasmic domain-containing protein [Desulfobacteraceae bacterium]|nr:GspL/Epsl periplasmic domain-containing protein [Desulfobacteraceae bacterium]HPQ27646.1 GspL/Epsl periplasmic domain-containing protein [Desulfobacteraceae bacterium]
MPGKILGLDINEDSITAVQVRVGLKGHQIIFCAEAGIKESGGLGNALMAISAQLDQKSDVCISSIPAESISFRNLDMPFKDRKKIAQTLPFEIEGMLPFPIHDLISDFIVNKHSEQSRILSASVYKNFISDRIMQMESCGIDPDILDIRCVPVVCRLLKSQEAPEEGLFLDIGEKRLTMVLFKDKHISLIRNFALPDSPFQKNTIHSKDNNHDNFSAPEQIEEHFKSFCALIDNTLHAFGWQSGRPVRPEKVLFTGRGALYPNTGNILEKYLNITAQQIDLCRGSRIQMDENIARIWNPLLMDGALALAIRDSKDDQNFNFRKDDFETKRPYMALNMNFRKAAVLLSVVFALLIADIGIDYYLLKERAGRLDQEMASVFRQTFPEVRRIVDPLQQMKIKINETRKLAGVLPGTASDIPVIEILKDISERIPSTVNINVTRIGIDLETVRISGKTDTYSTVDRIQNVLEGSGYFSEVSISSTNLDRSGNQVQFEIKLLRAR